MDIEEEKTVVETGRIDIDEGINPDVNDDRELFDDYSDANVCEEDIMSPKTPRKNANVILFGGLSLIAVVFGGYFFMSSGNTDKNNIPLSAPVSVSAIPEDRSVSQKDNLGEAEKMEQPVEPPEGGLLNNPGEINRIGKVETDNIGVIDYGQPPEPVPVATEKFADISPDSVAESIKNADSETASADTPDEGTNPDNQVVIADDLQQPGSLPLPGNIENLESEAKEIPVNDGSGVASAPTGFPVPDVMPDTKESVVKQDEPVVEETTVKETPASDLGSPETGLEIQPDSYEAAADDIVPDTENTQEARIETIPEENTEPEESAEETEIPVAVEIVKEAEKIETVKKVPAKVPAAVKKADKGAEKWVLRSAQMGVAWIAEIGGTGDLVRVAEGQNHPGIGHIKRIAPVNGRWIIEGEKGTISQ